MERAIFGAGCFWGVESRFRTVKGVQEAFCGYAGGETQNPTYQEVCGDKTGHAEVVEIHFDPTVVSYQQLLAVFWDVHDPTQLNRQGPDVGRQYRSVIFYLSEAQKEAALTSMEDLEKTQKFADPVVTEISPEPPFHKAEEYHQRYFEKKGISGGCYI